MVAIIHRGTPPNDIEYEATCGNCKTVFTFLRHEAREHHDQRDGSCVIIGCPVCGKDVWREL